LGQLKAEIAKRSDLRIVDVESIGPDYAKTLDAWGKNLKAKKAVNSDGLFIL
jgi:cyclopropane fatty-acyl-phospholipid synthase-like methyltransferase